MCFAPVACVRAHIFREGAATCLHAPKNFCAHELHGRESCIVTQTSFRTSLCATPLPHCMPPALDMRRVAGPSHRWPATARRCAIHRKVHRTALAAQLDDSGRPSESSACNSASFMFAPPCVDCAQVLMPSAAYTVELPVTLLKELADVVVDATVVFPDAEVCRGVYRSTEGRYTRADCCCTLLRR